MRIRDASDVPSAAVGCLRRQGPPSAATAGQKRHTVWRFWRHGLATVFSRMPNRAATASRPLGKDGRGTIAPPWREIGASHALNRWPAGWRGVESKGRT